jgi:chitodextrinase
MLTDLEPSTNYLMSVRAKDAAGNTSAPSSQITVRTLDIILPDTQAPTIPNGLVSGSVTETGFTLTWNASTDDVGVTGYDVYRNGGLLTTVSVNSVNLTGLSAGTNYAMTVRAKDVKTADTHAPTAPTGLSRSSLTQTSFTLTWTASTDNVGVTAYDVYRNGALYITVSATSANITGLFASTLYSMSVKARDAAGNVSAYSSVLDVTTPDTQAPAAPTGLSSGNISQSSFTLTYTGMAFW